MQDQHLIEERFVIRELVGQGRMSSVHLALDSSSGNTEVAIKILDTAHPGEIKQELFRRETDALRRLRHQNIVGLRQSGWSDSEKAFFLVLDYVPYSLDGYLAGQLRHTIGDLDIFRVMRELAEALAYAHSEGVVHRDIKPSNVLLDVNGRPLLADFGISKLVDQLTLGETLAGYWSSGYASPEQRSGDALGPSSDIYSLGAVFLHLLSGQAPPPQGPTPEMVDSLNEIPRPLKNVLKRMLSKHPEERFLRGAELLSRLDITRRLEKLPRHFLILTRNATDDLVSMGYSTTEEFQDVADALIEDLGGTEADEVHLHLDERDPKDLVILGDSLRVICTPHENRDALVVKAVQTPYMPNLDIERGRSMSYRALWEPVPRGFRSSEDPSALQGDIGELTNLLAELTSYRTVGAVRQEKRESRRDFIESWNIALTRGRRRLEREAPTLDYSDAIVDHDRVQFTLRQTPPDDLSWGDGTPLAIREEGYSLLQVGNLVEIRGRVVETARDLSRFDRDDLAVPKSGQLTTNIMEQLADRNRQQFAIGAFLNDQMANPSLPSVIVDPNNATRSPLPELEYFQDWLSEDKKLAVQKAVSSNELFLIQGPPGTGKTSVISEIVLQILRKNPEARILLASQSNIAVDHALVQIAKASGDSTPEMVRIGRSEKIAQGGQNWTLEGRAKVWRQDVLNGCSPVIDELRRREREARGAAKLTEETSDPEMERAATVAEWIAEAKHLSGQVQEYEQEYASLEQDAGDTTKEIVEEAVTQTRILFEAHLRTLNELLPSPIEIDSMDAQDALAAIIESDSSGMDSSETRNTAEAEVRYLQELRRVLTQWTTVVGLTEDFQALISQSARVVAATCSISGKLSKGTLDSNMRFDWAIVDEAGRATVPEVLIPMVTAERVVLVGDERQLPPMVDEMTAQEARDDKLGRSLFQTLVEQVSDTESEHLSSLQTQYRMNPAIGNLVSDVFYEGKLQNGSMSPPRRSAFGWMQAPVVWVSTSSLPDRHEARSGQSFSNETEVNVILQLLDKMERECRNRRRRPSVGVISGYAAQVERLITHIDPDDNERWTNLQIEVATVDSFQGRECDAVIYSTVRSNAQRRIGFLRDHRRINVAMSRARDLLVIVGDQFMMEHASLGSVPNAFTSVIGHIRSNPDECKTIQPGLVDCYDQCWIRHQERCR